MTIPLTQEFAVQFANEWIEAWNSHDLDRVLEHYASDVQLTSPFVPRILGVDSATIGGIETLRDYFNRALRIYPDLKFVPRRVYSGVQSVVIEYESVNGRLSAEMLQFNKAGKVSLIVAHYSATAEPI